jgi:hypothetical protein
LTGCTQYEYFSNTQGKRFFCTGATFKMEGFERRDHDILWSDSVSQAFDNTDISP